MKKRERTEDDDPTNEYGVLTSRSGEMSFPRSVLRGADMLLYAVVPVGIVSLLPMWGGNPPIHTMFTGALVFNIVAFQFGFLPSIYPVSWYQDEHEQAEARLNKPKVGTVGPPIRQGEKESIERDSDASNRNKKNSTRKK